MRFRSKPASESSSAFATNASYPTFDMLRHPVTQRCTRDLLRGRHRHRRLEYEGDIQGAGLGRWQVAAAGMLLADDIQPVVRCRAGAVRAR
jgi:hypothetical protein